MTRRNLLLLLLGFAAVLTVAAPDLTYAEEDRLAIKGYDPVAYFTEGKPMPGDPQFRYEFDDAVYQFISAKHLEQFKGDPDRYAPQHHNLCTASLARGEKVVADPNNWIIYEGRLYLFGKPIGPGKLVADPGMRERADANYETVVQLPDPVQQ